MLSVGLLWNCFALQSNVCSDLSSFSLRQSLRRAKNPAEKWDECKKKNDSPCTHPHCRKMCVLLEIQSKPPAHNVNTTNIAAWVRSLLPEGMKRQALSLMGFED